MTDQDKRKRPARCPTCGRGPDLLDDLTALELEPLTLDLSDLPELDLSGLDDLDLSKLLDETPQNTTETRATKGRKRDNRPE